MSKQRYSSRASQPPGAQQSSNAPAAPGASAPAGDASHGDFTPPEVHRDWMPWWLIILVFVIVEVALIMVMNDSWKYRSVIRQGKTAMAEERWTDAVKAWDRHVRNYPGAANSATLRKDRAISRMGAGDLDLAMADAEFLLKLEPKNLEYMDIQARIYSKMKNNKAARDAYRKILDASPYDAKANLFMGEQFFQEGKYAEAARYFQSVPAKDFPDEIKKEWGKIEQQLIQQAEALAQADVPSTTTKAAKDKPQAAGVSVPVEAPAKAKDQAPAKAADKAPAQKTAAASPAPSSGKSPEKPAQSSQTK